MTGAAPATCAPLSAEAFAERLTPLLGGERRLAVGVSGGGDSMALLALAAALSRRGGPEVHALTVDHGLRPESAAEAAMVARTAARLGVAHTALRWQGEKPVSNIQAAAREARYGLMRRWRRDHGVRLLAVAHNAEDQAETFLLRLARGSGVDGLAAMAALVQETSVEEAPIEKPQDGRGPLLLVRPLLDFSRETLRATCRAHGVDWIEDPSNQDARFDRVRARQALEALAPLGLTCERINRTARSMRRARTALEARTDALLADCARADRALGWVALDAAALLAEPREIGLRALARLLEWVSGAAYPPRLDSLEAALDGLGEAGAADGRAQHGRTLHGCVLAPAASGRWSIAREPAATAAAAVLDAPLIWDRRFRVAPPAESARALTVGPLGAEGAALLARRLRDQGRAPPADWLRAPMAARRSAPSIRRGAELLAAPGFLADPAAKGVILSSRPPLVVER